ncbi:RHS repeat-associated core domain-containing protein [Comamonas sp. MYb396]|uniref:RHS repeat-associated core domain-containing protein n=1 Tax=Comamonas sp. MYb396 TaxID=2745302 RepID=UPI0030AB1BDE
MTISTKFAARGTATAAAIAAGQQVLNGLTTKQILRTSLLVSALGLASLASAQGISGIGAFVPNTELGFTPVAKAGEPRINWINGEYQESNTDLSVKVLGGSLDIARSWSQGRWWLNPAWAPLSFELDPLGSDAKVIERVGVLYERSGQSDLYMAKSKGNAPVYIKRLKDAAGQHTGWQWYDRFGNTINYSQDGVIQSYANASGVKVSFAYDSATSARILDHGGKTIYTVTMAGGLITKIEDLAGRSVSYQWAGQRLAQVTDVMGHAWKYEYDANGQITSRTDPLGLKITAQYIQSIPAPEPMLSLGKKGVTIDPTGTSGTTQKLANLWGGGRVGQFDGQSGCASTGANNYLRERRVFEVTFTDCRGNATVTQYDLQGNELSRTFNGKKTASNQWDGAYHQKYTNARGYSTTTTYDSNYQPLQITHPDGSVEKYTYEPVFGRQSSYTNQLGVVSTWRYDSKGNVTEWVEAKGLPEQRTTLYTYDQHSQLTSSTKGAGDATKADAITQSWQYDSAGNVIIFKDGEDNTFTQIYDSIGSLVEKIDPENNRKTYRYNKSGSVEMISVAGEIVERFKYDSLNRRIQSTTAMGYETNIKYDELGRLTEISEPGDLSGSGRKVQYDKYGSVQKTISPSGLSIVNEYDEFGRISNIYNISGEKTSYVYGDYETENAGLLISTNYASYSEVYSYDQLGRKVKTTEIFDDGEKRSRIVQYNAAGERVAVINAAGAVTLFAYDSLGRLLSVNTPAGGFSGYSYRFDNEMTEFLDGSDNRFKYAYDRNGRVVKTVSPLGVVVHFTYNKNGKLISRVDGGGNIKEFYYDNLYNLQKEVYRDASLKTIQSIAYRHDLDGQVIEYQQMGFDDRLLSSVVYERDMRGRVINSTVKYGMVNKAEVFGFNIGYKYDRDGRIVEVSYPDSSVQSYQYTDANLSQIKLPNKQVINYEKYFHGKPANIIFPGSRSEAQFDGLYRLKNINIVAKDRLIAHKSYEYDVTGNIKQIDDQNGIFKYAYDDDNRLTEVEPNGDARNLGFESEAYKYDNAGNRIFSLHQPGGWVYAGNQLVAYPKRDMFDENLQEVSATYSPQGNLVAESSSEAKILYSYDATGRLIGYKNDRLDVIYGYDPYGRRISKSKKNGVDIDTFYYAYNNQGLVAEFDSKGVMTKAYGWGRADVSDEEWGANPVWQADVVKGALSEKMTAYNYIHNDHLGFPVVSVNGDGLITWSAIYDSFGSVKILDNSININLRFPGQYWDEESRSHYNYRRNYMPQIGRYIQSDPIGLKGGSNFYAYASSNPIMYYDPQGLQAKPCCQPQMTDQDCCNSIPTSSDGLNFEMPSLATGTVMCCQGRSISCLSKSYDHAKYGRDISRKCAKVHEDTHQAHVKKCPMDCSYFVNPFDIDKISPEKGECEAYGAELKCLTDSLPECGDDALCKMKIKASIASSKKELGEKRQCPM